MAARRARAAVADASDCLQVGWTDVGETCGSSPVGARAMLSLFFGTRPNSLRSRLTSSWLQVVTCFQQPAAMLALLSPCAVAVSNKERIAHQPRESRPMSNHARRTRLLLRYLAVVASALFIVLTSGTRSPRLHTLIQSSASASEPTHNKLSWQRLAQRPEVKAAIENCHACMSEFASGCIRDCPGSVGPCALACRTTTACTYCIQHAFCTPDWCK
jgi:hypothetical protein